MTAERVLHDDTATTTEQPELQPEEQAERSISIGERLRSPQTLISFGIAIAIIYFVFRQLNIDFGDVWRQIRSANPLWLLAGFVAYYSSFPVRAARWQLLLRNASISKADGHDMPGIVGLSEIYLLSWFANCIVPAKLGDAYRGFLLKKSAGPSFSRTLGTILAERLLDVVSLVAMMIGSGLLVYQGTVPSSLRWWFIAGVALVAIGIGGLIVLMTISHRVEFLVPARFRPYWSRLVEGILTSFSRRGLAGVSTLTAIVWFLEGLRVYAVSQAIGVDLSVSQAVFIALLASLLTTFPFTPAGLGVVEGGTVGALTLFDIASSSATAVALVDRTIASYSVIVFGGLLYIASRRT